MTAEQFEDRLSQHLHRKPFLPFVVEKNDGTSIIVEQSNIAHGHGGAVFLTPEYEFVEFYHEDVREMRPVSQEVGSP